MALDTTVGGASADSYCTLEEANAYHLARAFNSEWTAANDAAKEQALKWATRQMDVLFRFVGTKAEKAQARAWPRLDAWDADGFQFEDDEIPSRLKDAQAEFAFQLLKEDWSQGLGSVVDEGVKVGSLQTSKERHRPVPSSVEQLLAGLVSSSAGSGIRSLDLVF